MPLLAHAETLSDRVSPAALQPSSQDRGERLVLSPSPAGQEGLADWQVALLLGGTAVLGLASGVAALFGISLVV